jgi:hypothetical protein
MPDSSTELPAPLVESRILLLRGHKVLLDRDLAELYQVRPIALRQQVRRYPKRFPPDFFFELTGDEVATLLSQKVIPSRKSLGGGTPLAFTEHGVAMLSSVLTSDCAIEVHLTILRTFAQLRPLHATYEELAPPLDPLEWRRGEPEGRVQAVFAALQQLSETPTALKPSSVEPERRIGFPAAESGHGTTE